MCETRVKRYLLPFITGLAASILATYLVQAIADRRLVAAVSLDAGVGLCGIIAWQLWARADHVWRVLGAELAGSVLGTAIAMSVGQPMG